MMMMTMIPIVVTLVGIETAVSPVHPLKAKPPYGKVSVRVTKV